MHVLFVHPNYPAQFGHVGHHLAQTRGWRCTFVSETPAHARRNVGELGGSVEKLRYQPRGGATKQNHFCSRTFENTIWHCDGVLRALMQREDIQPDLIVGHSGFGSTLFLREHFPDVPCVNLFEYYYHPHGPDSDMTFRSDLGWPVRPEKFLRSRCRNAMILLDLQNCEVGYCPTAFQKSRFPKEYADKLSVVFDGIDTDVWKPIDTAQRPRTIGGVTLPAGAKVVTYCSRGFESMRGFDLFMRGMSRLLKRRDDVHVLIAGTDRVAYGGDAEHTGGKSFKEWTMAMPDVRDIDRSRLHFLDRLPPTDLATMLAGGDLHVYLTVPFVLSWSMINAMSCGATVLASDTPPVRDAITHGETGLLFDSFDPDALADAADQVLADPSAHRHLGRAARERVLREFSLDATMPQMIDLFERAQSLA